MGDLETVVGVAAAFLVAFLVFKVWRWKTKDDRNWQLAQQRNAHLYGSPGGHQIAPVHPYQPAHEPAYASHGAGAHAPAAAHGPQEPQRHVHEWAPGYSHNGPIHSDHVQHPAQHSTPHPATPAVSVFNPFGGAGHATSHQATTVYGSAHPSPHHSYTNGVTYGHATEIPGSRRVVASWH